MPLSWYVEVTEIGTKGLETLKNAQIDHPSKQFVLEAAENVMAGLNSE